MKLSLKAADRVHAEQDPALRSTYMADLLQFTADQLVFVDESAASECTKDRRRGWSPRSMPCRVKLPAGEESKRWSILPAIGIGGCLYCSRRRREKEASKKAESHTH